MQSFCEDRVECKRVTLLKYLGEKYKPDKDMGYEKCCSNCQDKVPSVYTDFIECAKLILEVVEISETQGSYLSLSKSDITSLFYPTNSETVPDIV